MSTLSNTPVIQGTRNGYSLNRASAAVRPYFNIIAVVIMAVILLAFFYAVFRYLDQQAYQEYSSLLQAETVGCPPGCIGGKCLYPGTCTQHSGPNPQCCAFDAQCTKCPDATAFSQEYEQIKQEYNQSLDREETRRLNQRIFDTNVQIQRLNSYITQGRFNNASDA